MPPPASQGTEVEAEDGKEGVGVQKFTVVPLETLGNVLALTASVRRGGSYRDSVGEKRPWTETLCAGTGCSSPVVPRGR
jgi:hypothetical protein